MIVVIGAMPEEVNAFLVHCSQVVQKQWNALTYYEAKLENQPVIVALSGVGKVNASFTTTYLIAQFKPSYVINIGCAGGIKEEQNVTDMVIASSLEMHDFDILQGYSNDARFMTSTDSHLINVAKEVMDQMSVTYHEGLIVSGDQFVASQEQYRSIQNNFPQAVAVEMESYAVAKVCEHTATPCVILRALSDIVSKENNFDTFESFVLDASRISAKITAELIKANPL